MPRSPALRRLAAATLVGYGISGVDSALAIRGDSCAVVDRGSPTDGATTITVIQPPAPCPADPVWPGWYCAVLESQANDNGVAYRLGIRWNRVGLPCTGTFTWLQGGGRVYHRENTTYAASVQDELDQLDGVRTVEIAVLGNAFLTAPRNGFPNISSVYADVLEFLVLHGVAQGVIGHFGNSAGSMIGANALAHHRLDEILDGMVLGGGPYWSDLSVTCLDPNWTTACVRDDVDDWNWQELDGSTPCATFDPGPDPPYDCRSTLGGSADLTYEGVVVAVIVGQTDPFLPWIDSAASDYFQRITAASKTYDRPAAAGHTLMNFSSGANRVLSRIRGIIAQQGVVSTQPPRLTAESSSLVSTPNPLASSTAVAFSVERAGRVRLTVHDATGRRVATIVDAERSAGSARAIWDGRDDDGRRVPAGVYFLRLAQDGSSRTAKVVVVR